MFSIISQCRAIGKDGRKRGCVEVTERIVRAHRVGAIYIFNQYSSCSSAVSSVDRNTSSLSIPLCLLPRSFSLFSSFFFLSFALSCAHLFREKHRLYVVSLRLAYLLQNSTKTQKANCYEESFPLRLNVNYFLY